MNPGEMLAPSAGEVRFGPDAGHVASASLAKTTARQQTINARAKALIYGDSDQES